MKEKTYCLILILLLEACGDLSRKDYVQEAASTDSLLTWLYQTENDPATLSIPYVLGMKYDEYQLLTEKDTLLELLDEEGNFQSRGSFVMDQDIEVSNLKIGYWESYYPNGQPHSKGKYGIGAYIYCGIDATVVFYNYRKGNWKY
ncbi:MAG: hypothetical protein AAF696_20660, partial [Bacteroidota bacterium]